jgi:hypothetical protein
MGSGLKLFGGQNACAWSASMLVAAARARAVKSARQRRQPAVVIGLNRLLCMAETPFLHPITPSGPAWTSGG